jgi:GAF domain-containing protein
MLHTLPSSVRDIVAGAGTRDEKLQAVSALIHDSLEAYDWVGFYLVDPTQHRMLKLGPYVGAPTDHVFIPFGKGICGQAAETLETFVIDDVTAQSNYLACSLDVKSEIVVPIMKGEEFIGELDIDSHLAARFGKDDQAVMEEICVILSALW